MARKQRKPVPGQLAFGFVQTPREVERVFLGWDDPLLPSTVARLVPTGRGLLDLRGLLIAIPSTRAGSRLLEALVRQAELDHRALLPPRVVSTGALVDVLVPPVQEVPHPAVRALLWGETLRSAPEAVRKAIVPSPPGPDDWTAWQRLGELLDRLDAELAAGLLSFDDVVERGQDLDSFRGPDRWRALGRLRSRFGERLRELDLDDARERRSAAIEGERVSLPLPFRRLLLVGAAELNDVTRRMVDLVRDRVTALVHAPASLASRFDRFGCVLPSEWEGGPIGEVDVRVVEGPAEQAACVAGHLQELAADYALQDVVIGVPDTEVVPFLRQTLDQLDVPTRSAAGAPLRTTGPVLLLDAVARYLESRTFDAFAALVRHPIVADRLRVEGELEEISTRLDRYQGQHVAYRLAETFPGPEAISNALALRRDAVDGLLGALNGASRPLAKWPSAIAAMLVTMLGEDALDPEDGDDRVVIELGRAIRAVLRALHALPDDVVGFVPGSGALRIALRALSEAALPEPADREAVELLGWLELPFDDAPALVVTGFNEGIVPTSVTADPFLPDTLRRHLGLVDNRRRFARDAFYLSSMLASREYMRILSGRRSRDSDPRNPSRLALCGDGPAVAHKLLSYYRGDGLESPVVRGRITPGQEAADFPIPKPERLASPISALAVTAFRDYLACPYRFYLQHVLRLRRHEDGMVELDSLLFGNLAHEVLCDFGRAAESTSRDAATIRDYLRHRLDVRAEESYGDVAHPAVRVQVEQLRYRLDAFARWQSGWASGGKVIMQAEVAFGEQAFLEVDGVPFGLRGRIDRIDRDESTGKLYIFDYKVPNLARTPEQDHRNKGRWTNLQLPLYRHMVATMSEGRGIELGYVAIPRDAIVKESLADWTEQELEAADEVARDVVRGIRAEVFWPPSPEPPLYEDAYSAICQDQSRRVRSQAGAS